MGCIVQEHVEELHDWVDGENMRVAQISQKRYNSNDNIILVLGKTRLQVQNQPWDELKCKILIKYII